MIHSLFLCHVTFPYFDSLGYPNPSELNLFCLLHNKSGWKYLFSLKARVRPRQRDRLFRAIRLAAEKWRVFVYGVRSNIFQTLLNCELSGKERGPNSTLEQKASNFMLCLGYKWHSLTRHRRQRHKLNLAPNHRLLKWRKDISATLLWHRGVILFYIVMVRLTPLAKEWQKMNFHPTTFPALSSRFHSWVTLRASVSLQRAVCAWTLWNVHHNENSSISRDRCCDLTSFSVPRKEPSNTDNSFCFYCYSTH